MLDPATSNREDDIDQITQEVHPLCNQILESNKGWSPTDKNAEVQLYCELSRIKDFALRRRPPNLPSFVYHHH